MEVRRSDSKMVESRVRKFRRPSKILQYFYSIAAALITFCTGISIGWTSPALLILESNHPEHIRVSPSHITITEASWVGSLLALGALFGALMTGIIVNSTGRKFFILSTALPLLASWLLIFFAKTVAEICMARILAGMVLGATSTIVPMYITEIAEDSVRGSLSSCYQFFISLGVLYVYVAGAFLSYYALIIASLLPLVPFVAIFYNAPETPVYLIMKNNLRRAEESFVRLRGKRCDVRKEFQALQVLLKQETVSLSSFKQAILKNKCTRALSITLGLMLFQQLSCINIVDSYASEILTSSRSSVNAHLATIIIGTAEPLSCLVSMAMADRIGRKILLIISAVGTTLGLAALGLNFSFKTHGGNTSSLALLPTVIIWCLVFLYGVGYGPIPWMMPGEVLPNEIKGFGSGLVVAVNWGVAFGVTKAFQPMLDRLGAAPTYWFFSTCCFVGLMFCIFAVRETKGKSFQEIHDELGGNQNPVSPPKDLIEMMPRQT